MKKGGNKRNRLLVLAMAAVLMTGCGSGYNKADTMAAAAYEPEYNYDNDFGGYATDDIYSYDGAAASEEMMEMEYAEPAEAGGVNGSSESPQVQDTNRKLIKNVNMEVETEEFDTLLGKVEQKVNGLGGYVESSYTYNGSSYYGSKNRNASMTIRIPAEKLDDFLSEVAASSNVISRNDSVTDVTLQYVDMESHKKVLLAEQDRLLELMEQVETIEDIITLESRLSDVRYQIESMESQLRTYDNQIAYSTIYLNIDEVTKLTPVKEQSTWEKISTGFVESLYSVGTGILNFIIKFIISLPYLVLWAVIILIIVLIIKAIRKSMKKRKEKKRQLQASFMQQPVQPQAQQGRPMQGQPMQQQARPTQGQSTQQQSTQQQVQPTQPQMQKTSEASAKEAEKQNDKNGSRE